MPTTISYSFALPTRSTNPTPFANFPSSPTFPDIQQMSSDAVNTIKIGAIIGGVLGGVALIAIVVLVWYWIRRRHPRRKTGSKGEVDEETFVNSGSQGRCFVEGAGSGSREEKVNEIGGRQTHYGGGGGVGGLKACEVDTAGQQIHEMAVGRSELPAHGQPQSVSCG